jgi:hypothetical protein
VSEFGAWLQRLPDDAVEALLQARPDARRHRGDRTSLAWWLARPSSLSLAVHRLDLFGLQLVQTCQAIVDDGRVHRAYLDAAVGDAATPAQLDRGLAELQRLALVWPYADELHLADLTHVLAPRPLGLGAPLRKALTRLDATYVRSAVGALGLGPYTNKSTAMQSLERHHADMAAVTAVLAAAPEPARRLLHELDRGAGVLHDPAASFYGRRDSPDPAVRWLAERAFLVPADWGLLEVPREVARSLRGGRLVRRLDPERPAVSGSSPPPPDDVDRIAAGAAVRLLETVTALADLIDAAPLSRLKDGGIGVRELRRLGAGLQQDEDAVTGLLTLLGSAGLLHLDDRVSLDEAYDEWLAGPAPSRYSALVRAWLRLGQPLSIRKPDGKLLPALVPVSLQPPIRLPALKQTLLAAHDGTVPSVDDLGRRAAWDEPLIFVDGTEVVIPQVLREAEVLGLIAQGTLSDAGRALLTRRPPADLRVSRWFPAAVEELVLQADLTAVVPGPPGVSLRSLLDAAADRESRGGASTWRFTPASVRRALDSGLSATDLLDRLSAIARHGVPQTLEYLIRDAERQHGRVRIGAAGCYLRCADPALAEEVVRTRVLNRLQLRQVAPHVLVAATDPDVTLAALQAAGFSPVLEDGGGEAVLQRVGGRRGDSGSDLAEQLAHTDW